jgi:CheY-like chemotaxis protein
MAFLAKPLRSRDLLEELLESLLSFLERPAKRLIVIEPDADRRASILEAVEFEDVSIIDAADPPSVLAALKSRPVDCMVVGPGGGDVARDAATRQGDRPFSRLPVVLFDDHNGSMGDGDDWRSLSDVCTVRRAHSPARLLDLAAYFLHNDVSKLPDAKRVTIQELHEADGVLAGRRVLIVDDDIRNIFALSAALEEHDMVVRSADNGRDAIGILEDEPEIELVLMDIMMPEMDGMETIREIRKIARLKNLPIVAVTAKAMRGDREKCIEAGAWDYLAKPVDVEQLLSVLRAWLNRREL